MNRARKGLAVTVCLMLLAGCSDYEDARRSYQRSEYALARQQFEALAKKGDTRAQFDLAQMYFSGVGGAEDAQQGWAYLLAAANGGNTSAMVEVAMRFASGRGQQQSLIMAARWYRRAAALGDPIACYNLAMMYAAGTEIPRDPLRAYAWYMIASKYGNPAARAHADALRSTMLPEDFENAQALIPRLLADPDA